MDGEGFGSVPEGGEAREAGLLGSSGAWPLKIAWGGGGVGARQRARHRMTCLLAEDRALEDNWAYIRPGSSRVGHDMGEKRSMKGIMDLLIQWQV